MAEQCWDNMAAGGVGDNGESRLRYFKKVVDAPSLSKTGWAYDWSGLKQGDTWLAFVTFLVGVPPNGR